MRPAEGLLPQDEIDRMIDTIREIGGLVSMRSLPGGGEAPYEINCAYFDAMSRTFEGEELLKIDRFLCSQTIIMSLEGIPAFYIHSMVATSNDHEAVERRGMNRAINRHVWDYPELRALLDDPTSHHAKVLQALQSRLRLRARQPGFHPNATQLTLQLDDRVLGVWRQSLDRTQSIFALHNVSPEPVEMDSFSLNLIADEDWSDLISGDNIDPDGAILLAPYQCRWISNVP